MGDTKPAKVGDLISVPGRGPCQVRSISPGGQVFCQEVAGRRMVFVLGQEVADQAKARPPKLGAIADKMIADARYYGAARERLKRGLILVLRYRKTQGQGKEQFSLLLKREDTQPSNQELEIVQRAFGIAGRVVPFWTEHAVTVAWQPAALAEYDKIKPKRGPAND